MSDNNKIRLTEIAAAVASRCGISNHTFEVKSGSSKGDNYMGQIFKMTINGDGGKKMNFMVKLADQKEVVRQKMPTRKTFLREIFMYERVFVEFGKLQENLEEKFEPFPKCYYSIEEDMKEALVLEDLNDWGYKMWNRREPMDSVHLEFVLKNYGKFHALSFALRDRKPELFEKLTKDLDDVFGLDLVKGTKYIEGQIDIISRFFDPEKDGEVLKKLNNTKKRSQEICKVFMETDQFSVITHGDCWCNNMMFRYEDPSNPLQPTVIRMLDFQLANFQSVVTDLSYFFYVCAPKQAYEQLDRYLEIYHDSFSTFLTALGCDASILSFQNLRDEWKKWGMFGLLSAAMVLRITLAEVGEVPDMDEMLAEEGNADMIDALSGMMDENVGEYCRRVRELVEHLVEIGVV